MNKTIISAYQKFCILRDQRRAGEEAPEFTELEAFEAATAVQPAQAKGEIFYDLSNRLALQAMQELNVSVFKVWATLDIDRPETITNFGRFGDLLAKAYLEGTSSVAAPSPAVQPAQAKCWSCKKPYTMQQRLDADGNCPHCGVELEELQAIAAQPAVQQDAWSIVCGHWKDEHVALHGASGHITSGLTIEQAQALIAAHGEASIDAARLDFICSEKCIIDHYPCADGTMKFALSWPYEHSEQDGLYSTPREAIDAAIAKREDA